ncbi:HAD family hydrolase [Rossellomorea marisflavi]|jgi:phosphoglycolate phosphatase|uniref:HAD family hydrolase n=1 Tax=Rossellomorea marisflavi TaxID=189381 RepID=A0A0M0GM37_9BACI|nr:HAD family hydrolase [Rossellomorea marisflavi]KON90557.1 HAD family hydrolase [Rossellomorea marisflavi]MCM2591913.1 HAD family hydrolase [Rossellomorea marisflavi]TYO70943.1 HAD family hydrolase [Rossellomorea marisflavi]
MDSIIFDLDGTIWDPIDTVLEAWNRTIEEHDEAGQTMTRADFEGVMGLQVKEIEEKLFPDVDEEVRSRMLQACLEREEELLGKRGGRLYPDVEKVLETLSRSYKLFIVSNCQDGYIETFYDYHKLERFFEDFENPGRTGLSKGENIKLIVERNNLKAPVYVGDTDGDRKAAESAGIPFVYAKYGFGHVEKHDEVLETFGDLVKLY